MAAVDDKESIKAVFRCFDYKQNKTIPREKLLQVLLNLDASFERQALVNLLELSDVVSDDQVRYEEFVDFIRPQAQSAVPAIDGLDRKKDADNASSAGGLDSTRNNTAEPTEEPRTAVTQEPPTEEDAEQAKIKAMKTKSRRVSVSAARISDEAMKDYKKPVYPKDDEAKEFLTGTLKSNPKLEVLCGHLGKEAVDDIVNAFYPKDIAADTDVIVQGDKGDNLYIIAEGTVEIFVNRPDADAFTSEGKGALVATWEKGALFGELALMYEAPRAATVTAVGPVKVFALESLDFKMLLMKASNSVYKKYDGWLTQVKLLESLNHFELGQLADIMQSDCFDTDEDIIVQGDEGDKFFILEDGSATAFIKGEAGEKEVKSYSEIGDYFGEIALLTDEPRRASVRAAGEGCSVAFVTKEDFINVLGPIAEKLRENVDKYPQYASF